MSVPPRRLFLMCSRESVDLPSEEARQRAGGGRRRGTKQRVSSGRKSGKAAEGWRHKAAGECTELVLLFA